MKLQKDSRTVLCDLDQYKTIQFNYNSPVSREFVYDISNFTKYNKRGTLTLHFDVKSSSFVLTDIYAGEIKIALGDYGRIIITCAASEAKRTLYRRIDLESLYNFHLYTSEWNTPKGRNFRSFDAKSKFATKSFFSKSKHLPVVEKPLTAAELQKDPLILKKSKYRYQTKAFWVKRSDFARRKWLRASKYAPVSTTRSHMSLSFSYDIKHKLLNFLLWKFNMTVSDLQAFFASNRMTSGNEMQSFAYWMLSRLPHILVSSGFCTNYSNANKMIKSGCVKLNGVPVVDVNYTVRVGDVLNVVKGENTSKSRFMTIPFYLTVNWKFGTILVNSNSTLNSSFASDSLTKLNLGLKRNKVSGGLKDPLMTLLWRFAPFIRNIGR